MKLVFSLTAGRTGSRSLAGLVAANVPGADVHHEQMEVRAAAVHTPEPGLLRTFNEQGNVAAVRDFWRRKLSAIEERPAHTWVESSHLLMKAGLVENLLDLAGEHEVHLVALTRPRDRLLRSYARIGDMSRLGNRWMWYLDPKYRRNLLGFAPFAPLGVDGIRLWYILEIEARIAWYAHRCAEADNFHLHHLDTADLSDAAAVHPLLSALRPGLTVAGVRLPPALNRNPNPNRFTPAEQDRLDAMARQVADFDAKGAVAPLVRRGRDPFAPIRPLPALGGPADTDRAPEVFIGGAGRSGTTALADLLGLHPRLSAIYETDFLPALITALQDPKAAPEALGRAATLYMDGWTRPLPHRPHNKAGHERYVHGPHHVLLERQPTMEQVARFAADLRTMDRWRALRLLVHRLFDAHARAEDKPRWVNKTPTNVLHAGRLLGAFPGSRFIHCVRDPRDVARSVVGRSWGPSRVPDVPAWWLGNIAQAWRMAEREPDRVLVVRYEDLVCSPLPTLSRVLRFVGEEDPEAGAETILRRHAEAGLTFDPSRIGRWRDSFTAEDRAAFAGALDGYLDSFGYGPTG